MSSVQVFSIDGATLESPARHALLPETWTRKQLTTLLDTLSQDGDQEPSDAEPLPLDARPCAPACSSPEAPFASPSSKLLAGPASIQIVDAGTVFQFGKTTASLSGDLGHLRVNSAAANQARLKGDNRSGLASARSYPNDYMEGHIIWAPFAATALDRGATPENDPKFVRAVGIIVQACYRLHVVVKIHKGCLRAIPIMSSDGNGPSMNRIRSSGMENIMEMVRSYNNGRKQVLPRVKAVMNRGEAPIKDGSYIDLSKDRPIDYKENIEVVGHVYSEEVDDLLREWYHTIVGEPRDPRMQSTPGHDRTVNKKRKRDVGSTLA